ncbi:hypothetical protein [Arsenophonus sp. PmNCSU2021_1]|uniref:hypothetical protein n=1 Tax=Arsenophonus sp. PmNCSU2021_1 TaxID=3118989 RepID=UPI002FEFB5C0
MMHYKIFITNALLIDRGAFITNIFIHQLKGSIMETLTKNSIFNAVDKLSVEEKEICIEDAEDLYESLRDGDVAKLLTQKTMGCRYQAWKLALEKYSNLKLLPFELVNLAAQYEYVMRNDDISYKVAE